MKPRQKGKQWEISYRCPGYSKPTYERFTSYEAAKLRIAEIEYEKSIGQLRPPQVSVPGDSNTSKKFITVGKVPGSGSLDDLKRRGRSTVLFTFPDLKQGAKTSLVLKAPKTASSVRTVFLPETVTSALQEMKVAQEADKQLR